VNQADVPRLKVDQTVEVTIEAVTGLKVNGTVERIAPQASIKNNIKGFAARIVLRNVDPRVRPGMTANIKIPVASAEDVTSIPLSAVFTDRNPETGVSERYVYVQDGAAVERRAVKVGVSDFFFAEIQEGLKPGEVVLLEMPREEREKKNRQVAGVGPGAASPAVNRTAATGDASRPASTNVATTPAAAEPAKTARPAAPASARAPGSST
jgi:HlyD family secretion protein